MNSHDLALALGAIGVMLTVASDLMRRMVPLRVLAIAANCIFATRSAISHNFVDLTLQVALFAVNAYRLWDLHRLLNAIAHATTDSPAQDWLLPYMKKRTVSEGTTLFNKGEHANYMVYVRSGTLRIVEADVMLSAGSLVGEIGLFSAHRQRTATVVCETKCVCYTMTAEAIHLLCFQNPKLGFFLIRLIVQRLLENLEHGPKAAEA